MSASSLRATLPLLPVLLLTGCPKGLNLDPFMPKVSFKRLKVDTIDFRHIETDFIFDVSNPNPIRVGLDTFTYQLDLAGETLLSGDAEDGFTLEPRGDSKLALPVSVEFADVIRMAGGLQGKDHVPFAIKGSFGFKTPLGTISIPFRESGKFPVVQAPKVAFKNIQVGRLDLLRQSATISVQLAVTHQGGSPISLSGFDYALDLSGRRVAEGIIDSMADVPVGQEQLIDIPVTLNLLQVGATIVDAITRKTKLSASLDATVKVATPFGTLPLTIDERGSLKVN